MPGARQAGSHCYYAVVVLGEVFLTVGGTPYGGLCRSPPLSSARVPNGEQQGALGRPALFVIGCMFLEVFFIILGMLLEAFLPSSSRSRLGAPCKAHRHDGQGHSQGHRGPQGRLQDWPTFEQEECRCPSRRGHHPRGPECLHVPKEARPEDFRCIKLFRRCM